MSLAVHAALNAPSAEDSLNTEVLLYAVSVNDVGGDEERSGDIGAVELGDLDNGSIRSSGGNRSLYGGIGFLAVLEVRLGE